LRVDFLLLKIKHILPIKVLTQLMLFDMIFYHGVE